MLRGCKFAALFTYLLHQNKVDATKWSKTATNTPAISQQDTADTVSMFQKKSANLSVDAYLPNLTY
jgi:hypothetical protein